MKKTYYIVTKRDPKQHLKQYSSETRQDWSQEPIEATLYTSREDAEETRDALQDQSGSVRIVAFDLDIYE